MIRIFLCVLAFFCVSHAAPNNNSSLKNSLLGNFASGSIVSGSTKAGNVKRWYLFNEGHVGYSFSTLDSVFGDHQKLHSVDLGYSVYITAINGSVRPYIGTEITAPIYVKSVGGSPAFFEDNGLPNQGKVISDLGFRGYGVQVPVIVGLQAGSFYLQAMAGYSYNNIIDLLYTSDITLDTEVTSVYQGFVYGLGAGIKVSNVFSIGLRYMMGELTSTNRDVNEAHILRRHSIRPKDFKNDYMRASIIFGVVF